MHLATVVSQIVEFRDPGIPPEGGTFEAEVEIDMTLMRKSGSPKVYFFRQVAAVLHHCIQETTIPREFWSAQISPWAQREFNLPATVKF